MRFWSDRGRPARQRAAGANLSTNACSFRASRSLRAGRPRSQFALPREPILKLISFLLTITILLFSASDTRSIITASDELALPQEKHLRNIKQLSFAGENAEAYFSADGQ